MGLDYQLIASGTLTSTGAPVNLELDMVPDYFVLRNFTNQNSTANPGVVKKAEWFSTMANASAFLVKNTNGAATDESSVITTNGFTPYVGGELVLAASQTGTAISQANPAVVTVNSHGLSTGDIVLLTNSTGMLQVSGQFYVVTAINANTFSIPVNSSGFAAAATAVTIRKVLSPLPFVPTRIFVTGITAASQAVITTSVNHGYSANDIIRVNVPTGWGMTQMAELQGEIVSVTSNTITVDINSSAFTAFAFPTSAAYAAGLSVPQVVPVGEDGQALTDATVNSSFQGLTLGSGVVGAASDVLHYAAFRSSVVNS